MRARTLVAAVLAAAIAGLAPVIARADTCCLDATLDCADTDAASCAAMGGQFGPPGTTCADGLCVERCCHPTGCLVMQAGACEGWWQGTPIPGLQCDACPAGTGACCASLYSADCTTLTEADCVAAGGDFLGAGSACGPDNACMGPRPCCMPTGTCALQALCFTGRDMIPLGGTTCPATSCYQPTLGPCCVNDGTCQMLTYGVCIRNGYGEPVGSCNDCTARACCLPGNACLDASAWYCRQDGGMDMGLGTSCATVSCEVTACCLPGGSCADLVPTACLAQSGTLAAPGVTCATTTCAQPEACCLPDGTCEERTAADCATRGGAALGPGTSCATATCPQPEACCLADGSCALLLPPSCTDRGGVTGGAGSTCALNPCAPAGACCLANGDCRDVTAAACAGLGGTAGAPGSTCVAAGCPARACCLADDTCADLDPAACRAQGGAPRGEGTTCATTACGAAGPDRPGGVPAGTLAAPGAPLTVSKAGGSLLVRWSASCSPGATDYAVHLGDLGTWYSHAAARCSTAGMLTAGLAMPAGNRYLVVVPMTAAEEGSFGTDSLGRERPTSAATAPCRPVQRTGCP